MSGILGCSNFYQGFQFQQRELCYRLPYPDQLQCLRELETGYDEYQAERKKIDKQAKAASEGL